MPDVTITNARILTLSGDEGPRHGEAMSELGAIDNGWLSVTNGRISGIGEGSPPETELADVVLDLDGRIVLPCWVDCHTHACWAGSRLSEWESLLSGMAYSDILAGGGGILSTVRAVRNTPQDQLVNALQIRAGRMQVYGTGTLEVKSGYGLSTESEVKMLRAIHEVSQDSDQQIVGTFLGAHAIDPEQPDFVDLVIEDTLPAVVSEFPGITCDAYLDAAAWSLDQTRRLFTRAIELGCPIRLHTDQFNSVGGVPMAIEMGGKEC